MQRRVNHGVNDLRNAMYKSYLVSGHQSLIGHEEVFGEVLCYREIYDVDN